jgi:hypothetical protein
MGRIRCGLVAQHSRGLLAQCQAWPMATPARNAGRLSAGRSRNTGMRKAVAARCWTVVGDAVALSNGGAPDSGASAWTLAPGDGSGHGGRGKAAATQRAHRAEGWSAAGR